jgi:hypothetical protein
MKPRESGFVGVDSWTRGNKTRGTWTRGNKTRGTERWLSVSGCGPVVVRARTFTATVAAVVGLVSVAAVPALSLPGALPARSDASSAWKVQATPNPKPERGSLSAVSCTSSTSCRAVGGTLAEAWNGITWKAQTTPKPAGGTSPDLTGVSCTAANACEAVGDYSDSSGDQVTLAERWNGTKWSVQTTPNPIGATFSYLYGVSCGAVNACEAVGEYSNSSGTQVTLAEGWNGTSWTVQTTPNPTNSLPVLSAVACSAANACTAVGNDNPATLAEEWNGTSWTIQNTPDPKGDESATLNGVACSAAEACTAVGFDYDQSGVGVTLAEAWNGTSWKIQATPNPTGGGETIQLNGVACSAANACTAVGSSSARILAEAWNGTMWTVQATPAAGATESQLLGVACSASNACTAVGAYYISSGNPATLAEAWNGTSWTVQATPTPKGSDDSVLDGVGCSAANACEAVGYYGKSSSVSTMLAEAWNGTTWTIQAVPSPTGATSSTLEGVACTAANACIAVGYYNNSTTALPLAEAWNGSSWTVQAVPSPTGATAALLLGTACSAANACTAVGYYGTSSGVETLAEAWNGTSWSVQATPNPTGTTEPFLEGVACSAANACRATGGSVDNSSAAFAEAWNGTSWKLQATPSPSGATGSTLTGVACTAANACTAAGYYENSSDVDMTLAEAWNGTSWTIQATPNPGSTNGSLLYGVACTAQSACTAVGAYYNSSDLEVTLAEAES